MFRGKLPNAIIDALRLAQRVHFMQVLLSLGCCFQQWPCHLVEDVYCKQCRPLSKKQDPERCQPLGCNTGWQCSLALPSSIGVRNAQRRTAVAFFGVLIGPKLSAEASRWPENAVPHCKRFARTASFKTVNSKRSGSCFNSGFSRSLQSSVDDLRH